MYILPERKYSSTTKYPCTDSAMYRLNIQLEPKMGIETCKYQKFVVLATLPLMAQVAQFEQWP